VIVTRQNLRSRPSRLVRVRSPFLSQSAPEHCPTADTPIGPLPGLAPGDSAVMGCVVQSDDPSAAEGWAFPLERGHGEDPFPRGSREVSGGRGRRIFLVLLRPPLASQGSFGQSALTATEPIGPKVPWGTANRVTGHGRRSLPIPAWQHRAPSLAADRQSAAHRIEATTGRADGSVFDPHGHRHMTRDYRRSGYRYPFID